MGAAVTEGLSVVLLGYLLYLANISLSSGSVDEWSYLGWICATLVILFVAQKVHYRWADYGKPKACSFCGHAAGGHWDWCKKKD